MMFVGTYGVITKTTTMDTIRLYNDLSGPGTVLDSSSFLSIVHCPRDRTANVDTIDDEVLPPKIQCIVATKSAQAGINSLWLICGKKKGLPASPYEQVQGFGCVDRWMNAEPGSNTYEIHLDLNSYVSLFVRTMTSDNASE